MIKYFKIKLEGYAEFINNNMSYRLIILLILLLSISKAHREGSDLSVTYRKFVYQKDMSEYCRRRVMPSVFLGRQVVDANSQILHFSRLEVPYSCYVNVRTEMGSNIIVVIQIITDIDLEETCKQGDSQLLIYELGETFGGYWGQLPDSVMRSGPRRDDHSYTLTTKEPESTSKTTESPTTTTTTALPTTKKKLRKEKQDDDREYLIIELPIVNVSAKLIPGNLLGLSYSTRDKFDMNYDVVPWSNTAYETSILPLLEVAVQKKKERLRDGEKEQKVDLTPEIEVELKDLFTPDPRLTFSPFDLGSYKRKSYKYHPILNRRLDFKKNKQLFDAKAALFYKKRLLNFRSPKVNTVHWNKYFSKQTSISQPSVDHGDETEHKMNSWAVLHDILNNLTKVNDDPTQPPHKELANILQGISNREFNESVYLKPLLSLDLNTSTTNPTTVEPGFDSIMTTKPFYNYNTTQSYEPNDTRKLPSASQDSNKLFNKSNILSNNESVNKDASSVALLPLALDVDSIILNVTNKKIDITNKSSKRVLQSLPTNTSKKTSPAAVPLVDHESWENLVNAAPVMAVKLKQSNVTVVYDMKREINYTTKSSKIRKKRYINAIDIEMANPHQVQIMKHLTTTPTPEKFDIREFQRLIELQDDEIHDRVAMRYVKQYMGLPLLNFCEFNESSSRHVYLFNSSRLVLALSNFTLKRMTVVVTPARTLLNSEARCGSAHLECQVSGARVCIDSHSACDGVPNCGSYDIYDEDRLRCGAAAGLRHNVCLAAVTFLAVLLTILYMIHYWLKRCVPRVSDAFFIYTDAAENVLYLEPMMRSPHDVGIGKDYYRGTMQQYMEYQDIIVKDNIIKRFFNRCLSFLRCKRKKVLQAENVENELENLYPQRLSNFAELEINKITPFSTFNVADVAVQTDSSLEVDVLEFSDLSKELIFENNKASSSVDAAQFMDLEIDSNQPSDELNILKFFRKTRTKSTTSRTNPEYNETKRRRMSVPKPPAEEREIECHEYDPDHYSIDQSITGEPIQIHVDKSYVIKPAPLIRKHLRFQEDAIIIPFPHDDDIDEENVESAPNNRRSIVFGANKVFRIQESEPNEVEEPSGGAAREFKSYFNWGGNKEKKKKKPKKK